jgi:hypothetical protein
MRVALATVTAVTPLAETAFADTAFFVCVDDDVSVPAALVFSTAAPVFPTCTVGGVPASALATAVFFVETFVAGAVWAVAATVLAVWVDDAVTVCGPTVAVSGTLKLAVKEPAWSIR